MSEKLKPCPFCGGAGDVELSDSRGFRVRCKGCGASMELVHPTQADAWRRWNHRVAGPQCASCTFFRFAEGFDFCDLIHQVRKPEDFCSKWRKA